jgi:hypothetical protein
MARSYILLHDSAALSSLWSLRAERLSRALIRVSRRVTNCRLTLDYISTTILLMTPLTTRQAAKKLGIDPGTLSRYVSSKKIPEPQVVEVGGFRVHSWSEEQIENVRKLLPKIANGRKTRWQRQREKQKSQPKAAVPHKQGQHKKQTKKQIPRPKVDSE